MSSNSPLPFNLGTNLQSDDTPLASLIYDTTTKYAFEIVGKGEGGMEGEEGRLVVGILSRKGSRVRQIAAGALTY